MIGKQIKGRGFRGLLNYLSQKEGAELIGGNMVASNARELAAEFRFSRQLNFRVQRVVYHASLSLPLHEHLDDETWRAIAFDYLNGMGFDYNQYCVFRHFDQDHDHIHIVASRIKLDGSRVSDSWDYPRSQALIRQLEQNYGLEAPLIGNSDKRSPTTGERRLLERTGKKSIRQKLQGAVEKATQSALTMSELISQLKHQGIDVKVTTHQSEIKGIIYGLNGVYFSGTQLGRAYTFPGLQKYRGIEYHKSQNQALQEISPRPPLTTEEIPSAQQQLPLTPAQLWVMYSQDIEGHSIEVEKKAALRALQAGESIDAVCQMLQHSPYYRQIIQSQGKESAEQYAELVVFSVGQQLQNQHYTEPKLPQKERQRRKRS